ncbi:MAG: cupin domain-containing protein [Xanthomonadaceae bacterium]|nr:cupin domain-containing protein [Xanthomonadaceae bacterium]
MAGPAVEVRARRGLPLGMPPTRFLRDYWQKCPLLIRGAFPDFVPPLSPDDLAGLACMDGALARIVLQESKRDRWTVLTGPFDNASFTNLPATRWTLLVQDVDKWDADTAALLQPFAFIPGWRIDDVMISYAVDGGGVGAHVDQYDVFLLQGYGRRRWAIDNRADPPTEFRGDVELKLLKKFAPTHAWTLEPGDMLYLPPGVPHNGVAVGECTTFSIGMRAPAASELLLDFAIRVAEALPESRRFADPDLKPAKDSGEIDAQALRRARDALGPAAAMLDNDAFADWFGCFVTRYRVAQAAVPRKRAIDRGTLAKRLPHALVERDPWSRFAWHRRGRAARLYAAGGAFDAPIAWACTLAGPVRELDGEHLAGLAQQAHGVTLLANLIDAGHFRLRHR